MSWTPKDKMNVTYGQLILQHLLKISQLTTVIAGETITGDGRVFLNKDADKEKAFNFSVEFMEAILPDNLWDETITNGVEALDKEFQNGLPRTIYSLKKLKLMIDTLARKGHLFDQNTQMIMSRASNKLKENSIEVFEA